MGFMDSIKEALGGERDDGADAPESDRVHHLRPRPWSPSTSTPTRPPRTPTASRPPAGSTRPATDSAGSYRR